MVPLAVYLRVPDSFDHVIKSNPWTDSTLIVPVDRLTIYSTWITPHAYKAGVLKSGYYPLKGLKYILFKMIQVISILEKFYYSSVCFPFAPPRKHLGKNTQVRGHTSIAIRVAGKKIGKKWSFAKPSSDPHPPLVWFFWWKTIFCQVFGHFKAILDHFWPFLRPQTWGLVFCLPSETPPPPGLAKDHCFSGFFFATFP